MDPEPILTTKLSVPPGRARFVRRPRLIRRLAEIGTAGQLVLLSAPPGFGKTTLLSSWLQSAGAPPAAAWLSLDANDNVPGRFVRYCLAALRRVWPHIEPLSPAAVSGQSIDQAGFVHLINQLATIPEPFRLILDDYQVIGLRAVQQGMTLLLENLPPQLQLLISSQSDPRLPLARLRARGQLLELRSADLRFNTAEVAEFLNQVMELDLAEAEIAVLEARTEGWIAGLQMAALSLQGRTDAAAFIKSFTGSHHHIFDYLSTEVLQQQSSQIQQFLLYTSILERLTGSLCQAVLAALPEEELAGTDSLNSGQAVLRQLEQANLFIVPLDEERRWYRYHHLFTDLLRHRLRELLAGQPEPEARLAALHRQASDWYEEHGLPTEALHHALAAVDVARVVRLVRQQADRLLSRSELITLLSWLDTLPQALTPSRPRLSLLYAWAMVLTGQVDAVEPHLQAAERALRAVSSPRFEPEPADIPGEVATLRATVAYFQRNMESALAGYRQALSQLPDDNLFLRGAVMQSLGAAYSWLGQVSQAAQAFSQAVSLSQESGQQDVMIVAWWNLAQARQEQGQLPLAAQLYRQARQLIERRPDQPPATAGRVYLGLADILYHWDQLAAAESAIQAGLSLGEQTEESDTLVSGYLGLARLKQATEDYEAALDALWQADRLVQSYSGPAYWASQVAVGRARLWLAQAAASESERSGHLQAVADWLRSQNMWLPRRNKPIPFLQEAEYLILVRFVLAQAARQAKEGVSLDDELLIGLNDRLTELAAAAQESGRQGRLIEILLLQSLLWQTLEELEPALESLTQALTLAEPAGYIRLFVDEGRPMAQLLHRAASHKLAPAYVTQLLAAFQQPAGAGAGPEFPPLVEPLSERELEILPLLAAGLSNQALAESLVLTVGTVKWHLNNIYSKLGVHSRTQAVARARELGLL